MKIPIALTTLYLLVFSMSTIAQDRREKPGNTAHESMIDGRWEAKLVTEEKPIAVFEFKNATGVLSGLMIQDGKSTEITNGSLEGANLKFETTQVSAGGGTPIKMTWTGVIVENGESINLTCTPETVEGQTNESARSQQMEARRVK